MRRDELMDGYIWLYEQAYGTSMLYDRIERNWRRRAKGSSFVERALIASRLAPEILKGDAEARRHYGDGIKLMMSRGLNADAGQLLYLLDAYDFARFLRRFSTARRAEKHRTFSDPACDEQELGEEKLAVLQWQNKKAVKRTQRASLPLVR
jgi:hypothetical protein